MELLILKLIILSILLFFSAFFSGSETALFSLQKSDIINLTKSRKKNEKKISQLMQNPQKILITILIGNLIVNLFLSSVTTELFIKEFPKYGHIVAIAIVTPLIIVFGEIVPKIIALSNSVKFSKSIVSFLSIFHSLFFPLRIVYQLIARILVKVFRINLSDENKVTEEELDLLIAMSENKGFLKEEEGDFIRNILRRFSKKTAENVMIPRNNAVSISYGTSIEDAIKIFKESGVVRAVVYQNDMDHVVGQIDSRDLIPFIFNMRHAKNINKLINPIGYYPETRELGELLDDFLKSKIQLAVVIDEYGGTSGIVTLSSILSELLGEKFSLTEKIKKPDVKKVNDSTYIISGDMQISDFNFELGASFGSFEAETMGGFITEKLGHFPKKNDEVKILNFIFKVKTIYKNKISKLEVKKENV